MTKPNSTNQRQACKNCGSLFRGHHSTQLFCNRACWREHKREKSSGYVTLKCEQCGTEFQRYAPYHKHLTQSRGITRAFCSRSCKSASQQKAVPAEAIGLYEQGSSCSDIARAYGLSADQVRRFLVGSGITLRSRTAHLATDKNPTKGKGHSEATKAKLRAATLKQFANEANRAVAAHNQRRAMAEGKIPKVSKLEDVVAAELDRMGIPYRRQWGIIDGETGRYCACVDFLLDDKTVVEVNGTFWHSDPRAYPKGPIHASQHRVLKIYARKMTALKKMGIRVIEIWEIGIMDNATKAVREAL